MSYGKDCIGKHSRLAKLAQNILVFADIENECSRLHIDNLCELIKVMIGLEETGLFFPKKKEYVKTNGQ